MDSTSRINVNSFFLCQNLEKCVFCKQQPGFPIEFNGKWIWSRLWANFEICVGVHVGFFFSIEVCAICQKKYSECVNSYVKFALFGGTGYLHFKNYKNKTTKLLCKNCSKPNKTFVYVKSKLRPTIQILILVLLVAIICETWLYPHLHTMSHIFLSRASIL